MRSREDSVLHRWSTEGLLHLPDMRAHPERTWATSQRELQQGGESPGPALSCFLAPGVSSFLELWREPLLTRITTSGNLHDLPGLERSAYFLILEYWEINISLATERAFLVAQSVKNLLAMQEITCNAGDLILIPGLGRSSEKGNGNPLHCSCLENPTDRGTWWAMVHRDTKSDVI